jgi:hypothetical protein
LQDAGAAGTTIQPGDVVNGGAGTDTLSISVAGDISATASFTISAVQTNSVENILAVNFNTDDTADLIVATNLMTDVAKVGSSASSASGDTQFSGMKNTVVAEMTNGAGDLTLTYDGAQIVSGAADSQTLNVSNMTAGTFTANGIETLNINTGLVKSTLTNVASDTLKTVNVAGASDLTISTALTATTINAATATGALTVTLGAAAQTVTGGAAADTIDASTNLANDDVIVGGAGVDTLKISTAATVAVGTAAAKLALFGVSGVEVIDVASTNDAAILNLDSTVGVTNVVAAANVGVFGVVGTTETDADVVNFTLNGVVYKTAGRVNAAATDEFEELVATKINTLTGFTAVAGTNLVTITNTSGTSEAVEFGSMTITGTGTVAATATTGYTNVSFTNLGAGQVVDIFSADQVAAGLKDAAGTTDALSINLKTLAADKGFNHTIGTVTANLIETINLSTTGMTDGKIKTVTSLAASGIKTLNITGESDLTISGFGTQATTIDGSTATADLNLTVSTKDQSIKTGSGNDTINMAGTLTAADTIDGGANNAIAGGSTVGKDKLTASGDIGTITAPAALKIANVETIEISNAGAAATYIDAAGITGATSLAFTATSGTAKVTNLAANTTVGLAIAAVEFVGTMDLTLADATGAADTINLSYAAADDASTVVVKVAAAVETVSITTSTEAATADTFTITSTDLASKNIVVTGNSATNADTLALGTLNAATTNLDASAYKGILTATTAATGAVTVSASAAVANNITTGAGADTITLVGDLAAIDQTIAGGTGLDTLNATLSTSNAVTLQNVTAVETLNLTVGANVQASFANTTNAILGLNAATAVNIKGGDALSSLATGGTTGVVTAKTAAQSIDASGFAGNLDLIVAAGALNSFMTLKAGALTTDKVTTTVTNATTGAKVAAMSGVETLVINSTLSDAAAKIDLTNVTGLTTLDAVFTTGGTLSQIAVDKLASGVAVTALGAITNDNLVIDLADKAAADNALSLELKGVGVAVANDILNVDAAGVETLNIKASNTRAVTLDLAGVAATATAGTVTVNVTGAGGVIFKTLSALTNVVNASAATGAITLASADRAATAMTITTGTGVDSVAMRHANDVLNGGLGTDTLVLTPNFVLGGVQVDLNSATDQVTTFNGSANAAVQIGFENVDLSGVVGNFGADVTAKSTGSTITGTANSDVITGGAGNDTIIIVTGTSANADAVVGGAGLDTIYLVDGLAGTTTAQNVIDLTTPGNGLIANVAAFANFSGFENIDVSAEAGATDGFSLKGDANANIIKGSAGDDIYTVTAGNDTVTLGAADDAITVTTALLAANSDTTATIDGGAGTDTMTISDATTTVVDADFRGVTLVEVLTLNNNTNSIALGTNAAAAGIVTVNGGTTAADTVAMTKAFAETTGLTLTLGTTGTDTVSISDSGAVTFANATVETADALTVAADAGADAIVIKQAFFDTGAGTSAATLTITGGGDADNDTLTILAGTTAWDVAGAETQVADVNAAGEFFLTNAGAADGVLTYYNEAGATVVTLTIVGLNAGAVALVGGSLVFTA